MTRRNRFSRYLLLILFCLSAIATAAAESTSYTLARPPQLSSEITERDWLPFVNYLCKKSGLDIRLKLYAKRSQFEDDLVKGTPDLFFGNPGYMTVAHRLHQYLPLVRSGSSSLKGIIVTRVNSGITTIQQLDQQEIAFPGENAFAASLYLRSMLKTQAGIRFTPIYVRGHDNVYRNVLSGNVIAGGGVLRTLNRENDKLRAQLKILYQTPGLPPHPLAYHPRVPLATRNLLSKIILAMPGDPEGKVLLEKIKLTNPVRADYAHDYQSLEKVALGMYADLIE